MGHPRLVPLDRYVKAILDTAHGKRVKFPDIPPAAPNGSCPRCRSTDKRFVCQSLRKTRPCKTLGTWFREPIYTFICNNCRQPYYRTVASFYIKEAAPGTVNLPPPNPDPQHTQPAPTRKTKAFKESRENTAQTPFPKRRVKGQ
jgi:hypothetical protein